MSFQNTLEVDLGALKHNVKAVQQLIGQNFFCPVIKANAYGLGALRAVETLMEAGVFNAGVFSVKEALYLLPLQQKGLTIYVMGPLESEDFKLIKKHQGLVPFISLKDNLEELSQNLSGAGRPRPVHIKFNAGMSRLGFDRGDIPYLISFFKNQNQLQLAGLCGHLPGGGAVGLPGDETQNQIKEFKNICDEFSASFQRLDCHLFNSLSFMGCHALLGGGVEFGARVGGLLYGIKPSLSFQDQDSKKKWQSVDVRPVSSLKSCIISSRAVEKGQGVSYEKQWRAERKSHIGISAMGYKDGFWRAFSNRGKVLFRGQKVSVVGAVCMDMFMVDLTDVSDFGENITGEEIVIYGRQKGGRITIEETAVSAGAIAYEVMTNVGFTANRVYKN